MAEALTVVPVNQPIELEVTVSVDGVPTDPTAGITFRVRKPDGTIVNVTGGVAAGGGSGRASVVYDAPDLEGDYWWSFAASNPKTWEQHMFVAEQDRVAATGLSTAALTSVNHARLWIKRRQDVAISDETIELLINGYSRAVQRYCDRQFRPAEDNVTRSFSYDGAGYLSLVPYELRALDTISVNVVGGSARTLDPDRDYVLAPREQTSEGTYFWITFLRLTPPVAGSYEIAITGDWGCASVPADVETATLIAVSDGYRNPEGGAIRTVGELQYSEVAEASDVRGRALPPDSRALLDPFVRVGI
jgi:hypothetical protein